MGEPIRVLVCGGRNFSDEAAVIATLDRLHAETPFAVVIHGGARGADTLAGEWAASRRVPVETYPADWRTHGKAAGLLRNTQMLVEGKPDLCVALRGGRGTADMVAKARRAGVPVIEP